MDSMTKLRFFCEVVREFGQIVWENSLINSFGKVVNSIVTNLEYAWVPSHGKVSW